MTLSFQDTPEGTLITLQGRLDAMTSPVAQAEIERHLGAHPGPVTFDCSGLSSRASMPASAKPSTSPASR
jgi:anti-anti-sigma regulatory factor